MGKHHAMVVLALGLVAAHGVLPLRAQEPASAPRELRDAFATLLGLDLNGSTAMQDGSIDVYRSVLDDPAAPRLLTRLEVGGNGCRARTTSALQYPGQWAVLSLTMTDLHSVTRAVAYRSVDDLIAERNPLPPHDPDARQLVLEGKGLRCTTRLSLEAEGNEPIDTCRDRLDIELTGEASAALALMAAKCNITVLRH